MSTPFDEVWILFKLVPPYKVEPQVRANVLKNNRRKKEFKKALICAEELDHSFRDVTEYLGIKIGYGRRVFLEIKP
jgi:hypothetical protein